jgi:hypothetical protein
MKNVKSRTYKFIFYLFLNKVFINNKYSIKNIYSLRRGGFSEIAYAILKIKQILFSFSAKDIN